MKLHIEYCEKWNYKPEFDRVSNIINSLNYNVEIKGNLAEPRTGSFEVKLNDKLVFSKFQTDKFPDENQVLNWFKTINVW